MPELPLVIVPAGGRGTRLGRETSFLPKPMIRVGGRPFFEHVLDQLSAQGFSDVLLLTGYRSDVLERHFGDGTRWRIRLRYSQERTPLGTGGALRLAAALVSGRFLWMYADLFRAFDYSAFCRRHGGSCLAVYCYVPGLTTIACGNVTLDAEGRRVTMYRKDDPGAHLPYVEAGFGVFDPSVFRLLPEGTSSFEGTVYPALAARGILDGEVVDRNFFDIGNPADLESTRAAFSSGKGTSVRLG